ncbi:MAG: aspartyl/asparaginyl beta-hydroxylase domain-containing protein [Pseudomonadota bacterium]
MEKSSIMQHPQPVIDRTLATLPDRIRLSFGCAVTPLVSEVAALPAAAWTRHFVPDNYRGEWSVVPLCAPAEATHPIMQITSPPSCADWVETEYLAACPAIRTALKTLCCSIGAVRLMRLGPASEIREHRDHDLAAEYGSARLHLPLTTNLEVKFLVNKHAVVMQPGEWWYLRLSDPHSVVNHGASDRIHLVVDVQMNDWLAGELRKAAF